MPSVKYYFKSASVVKLTMSTGFYCIQRLKNIFSDIYCEYLRLQDCVKHSSIIVPGIEDKCWRFCQAPFDQEHLSKVPGHHIVLHPPYFLLLPKTFDVKIRCIHPAQCPSEGGASNLKFSTICCQEEKLESPCPTFQTFPTFENIEGRMLLLVIGSSDATKLL